MFRILVLALIFASPAAFAGKHKESAKRAPESAPKCARVACTKPKPVCTDTQILVNKAEEGACCADWECIDDETEEL